MTFRATAMEQQLRANAEPQPDKLTIRALECRKTICFIETAAASPGDLPITDYRWRACRIASDEMLPGRAPLPQVKCYRRRRLPPCSLQHLGGVMATKMTHTARVELASAIRQRYRSASTGEKGEILDEFIAATGYHEKSAIRVLNAEPTAKGHRTRARPSLYDEAARVALIVLWEASDRAAVSG